MGVSPHPTEIRSRQIGFRIRAREIVQGRTKEVKVAAVVTDNNHQIPAIGKRCDSDCACICKRSAVGETRSKLASEYRSFGIADVKEHDQRRVGRPLVCIALLTEIGVSTRLTSRPADFIREVKRPWMLDGNSQHISDYLHAAGVL